MDLVQRLWDGVKQRIAMIFYPITCSIHRFLVAVLLLILTVAITIIGTINYVQINRQNQHLFETQLISSAQILDAITSIKIREDQVQELANLLKQSSRLTITELLEEDYAEAVNYFIKYQDILAFQVWNTLTKQLILKSENAPETPINKLSYGFSRVSGDSEHIWSSFSITNRNNHTRIIIAVRQSFHDEINKDLLFHDLSILFIVYIVISAIILTVVQVGLKHLIRVTRAVATRDAENLTAIDMERVPEEILPLVRAINDLFDKLEQTLARERRFTADAAHELRTPIAALKTHAEVALREQDATEKNTSIEKIIKSSDRCTHVVEQLLTLCRLEPDNPNLQMERFDFNALACEMIAELVPLALAKNITLSFEPPSSDTQINASMAAIGILLRNLIDNAIRYTPEQGTVTVMILQRGQDAELRVTDSGPGVPEAMRKQIFHRFYRQMGNKQEGSGLGLSIVKEIARLHDAKIEAHEAPSGQGLEMRFTIARVRPGD